MSTQPPESIATRRVLSAAAIASAVASCYAIRQVDPDLFGYLAYGRLFTHEGTASLADPFAYTSQGRPWISFEYLSQVVLWLTFDRYGPLGLIALKCALGGIAVYFLSVAVRRANDDPVVWAPPFVLSTVILARYFLFRPQLFTFAFFALFVATVFGLITRGTARLWVLPIASLVWASTHGGFPAGLAILGLAIALETWRQFNDGTLGSRKSVGTIRSLAAALAACTAATLVNPHGGRLWTYVLNEITHGTNRRYIAEWRPASLRNDPVSFLGITELSLLLVACAWIAHRRRLKVSGLWAWQWVAASSPIVGAAYLSVRHVPIAVIWLGPVITLLGSAISRSAAAIAFRRLWFVVSVSAIVVATLEVQFIVDQPKPEIVMGSRAPGTNYPCGALAYIKINGLRGKLYTPLWWGSYITWEAFPAILVSMDGRNISLFSDEMVAANLRFYSPDAGRPDIETPERYAPDFLLVPADQPVLAMVRTDRRWRQIYADTDARLFVRADPDHASLLAATEPGALLRPEVGCPRLLTHE